VRRSGHDAVTVREPRHDHDHAKIRARAKRIRERLTDIARPEVLILDVEQRPRPPQRRPVEPRDGPLSARCERIGRPPRRIRPQDLHRVPAGARRGHVGGGQQRRPCRRARQVHPYAPARRAAVLDGGPVVPPFAERLVELRHRRPVHLRGDVVPGRAVAVPAVQVLGLQVAEVPVVVAPPVAQVDPADEREAGVRVVGPVHDDQLLVVRTGAPHALVQQHLATGAVHDAGEHGVLLLVEAHRLGMRAPQQRADLHAPARESRQQHGQRRTVVGQEFVVIAAPVGEAQEVAGRQRLERLGQPREVGAAVDQRRDVVALGPGDVAHQRRALVHALARVEEPRMPLFHPPPVSREALREPSATAWPGVTPP
jgi:hypothetical protein